MWRLRHKSWRPKRPFVFSRSDWRTDSQTSRSRPISCLTASHKKNGNPHKPRLRRRPTSTGIRPIFFERPLLPGSCSSVPANRTKGGGKSVFSAHQDPGVPAVGQTEGAQVKEAGRQPVKKQANHRPHHRNLWPFPSKTDWLKPPELQLIDNELPVEVESEGWHDLQGTQLAGREQKSQTGSKKRTSAILKIIVLISIIAWYFLLLTGPSHHHQRSRCKKEAPRHRRLMPRGFFFPPWPLADQTPPEDCHDAGWNQMWVSTVHGQRAGSGCQTHSPTKMVSFVCGQDR